MNKFPRKSKAFFKELFGEFAREEEKHEKILARILDQEKMDTRFFSFDKDFKVAETIKIPEVKADMNLKDAIGIAMKTYLALAENCTDPQLTAIFRTWRPWSGTINLRWKKFLWKLPILRSGRAPYY